MSAHVVSIRGGKCRRRKNRAQDADTIRLRRLLATCTYAASENEDATALALSWAMEGKLPNHNLRLIAGTLEARRDFQLRVCDVDIARAESELWHAKIARTRILHGKEAAEAMYPENERAFERYRQAVVDMANAPVFTRADLRRKRSAVGEVWLRAEGAWYDQLRAAVDADEERLSRGRQQC